MSMSDTLQSTSESRPRAERTVERPTVTPAVDIYENAEEILLVTDLPGVARNDVTVDLDKNQLTLTARRTLNEPNGATHEFDYHRAFTIPQGIDAERIAAELNDGVLSLHLPKSAAMKPRRIEVRAG